MDTPYFFNGSLPINLRLALDSLETYIEAKLFPEGITIIQWYTLLVLYTEKDTLTISEVARRVRRKPNSFTHVVRDLVALGYVVRVPDKTDHRRVWLHLTDKAHANREAFLTHAEEIERELSQMIGHRWDALLQSLMMLDALTESDDD